MKLLYRGFPPGAQTKDPGFFSPDLGQPYCIFTMLEPAWDHPLTLNRSLVQQQPDAGVDFRPCSPRNYTDGTPHFFETVWREATGMPHIKFCPNSRFSANSIWYYYIRRQLNMAI